jgi:hypothetical protein
LTILNSLSSFRLEAAVFATSSGTSN